MSGTTCKGGLWCSTVYNNLWEKLQELIMIANEYHKDTNLKIIGAVGMMTLFTGNRKIEIWEPLY